MTLAFLELIISFYLEQRVAPRPYKIIELLLNAVRSWEGSAGPPLRYSPVLYADEMGYFKVITSMTLAPEGSGAPI